MDAGGLDVKRDWGKRRGPILLLLIAAGLLCLLPACSGRFSPCDAAGRSAAEQAGIVEDPAAGRWYYGTGGQMDASFTGFAQNDRGWWYVDSGLVDFRRTGVVEGVLDGVRAKWYVLGGRALTEYSGLTRSFDSCPALMLEKGIVDEHFTGMEQNEEGWWYLSDGMPDPRSQALVAGSVAGVDALWYVRQGKVQLGWNGYASLGEETFLIEGGHTAPGRSGIFPDSGRFLYVVDGKVDTAYRGAQLYDGAKWILIGGRAKKVTSDADRMLYNAMLLADEITDASMGPEEKLQVCFDYVTHCRTTTSRSPHMTSPGWTEVYAADILEGEGGNCCSFAATFAYLAKAIGFDEVYALNSGGHGWAEVNGLIYDPERAKATSEVSFYAVPYERFPAYMRTRDHAALEGREWMRVKIVCEDLE